MNLYSSLLCIELRFGESNITNVIEVLLFQSKTYWLHEWLLTGWGMLIGELFDLEKLATEYRKLKKWIFFFSSVLLKVTGGVASPPNGVAIL